MSNSTTGVQSTFILKLKVPESDGAIKTQSPTKEWVMINSLAALLTPLRKETALKLKPNPSNRLPITARTQP